MSAAILCIGTEITRGEIVNTNATWLASKLTEVGFDVAEVASVGDDRHLLVSALRRLGDRHDVIMCTGGLGPTTDDLTAECAAVAARLPLIRDGSTVETIRDRFRLLGRTMVAANVKQADFPAGARVLSNAVGTAPGFSISIGRAIAYFFPGVPRELHQIWKDHVDQALRAIAPSNTFQTRIKTFGKPESTVGQMLEGVESRYPGVIIGYRASFPEIEVKVLASGDDAHARVESAAMEIREKLGAIVYGENDDTFVGAVATSIRAQGYKLALAESCTGGLIAHMLTSEPASDYLTAAMVTYSNEMKTALLGVPTSLLETHGAVSEEVAVAMAQGAAKTGKSELGLGITGIAGPTGGSEDKPLGLVHWAVAHPKGVSTKHRVFPGDRKRVQLMAAYAALALLRKCSSPS